MTFNLRFDNERDGADSWLHRRESVLELIRRYAPSVLGTQEGLLRQLDYLRENLPDYELYAPGREYRDRFQYPTLFFRRNEIRVREGSEFWLSKTPDIPGSKDWESAYPRMISCAKVTYSTHDFWAAVTHLDHISGRARLEQARLIAEWVKQRREPVILMGDFNDHPGSSVHQLLTSSEIGLRDSWQVLAREEGSGSYTHHGFKGIPQNARMDWILVGPSLQVLDAAIIRDHLGDRYPSDHFPYALELGWEEK